MQQFIEGYHVLGILCILSFFLIPMGRYIIHIYNVWIKEGYNPTTLYSADCT